jgi:imidazole glycerol-phosphate synthase subunit HisF
LLPDVRPIPRVIPCLLVDDDGMVKTVQFKDPDYLGDPVNIINLFNRFEVDEIALLDIRATVESRNPPFELIDRLASECWVPLTYGGGIRTFDEARTVFRCGVEKVVIGTAATDDPDLVTAVADTYGSQAVVVAIDVTRSWRGKYDVQVESGTRSARMDPVAYALRAVSIGAGEILLTSIDRDGTMTGYDLDLVQRVASAVDVPVVACGGAGSRSDLPVPVRQAGASAVAAGSIFVYQGPERGVLVNFPERPLLERLFA